MKNNKALIELIKYYPNPQKSLNYNSPFELLICLILAAQCTDKRVNKVTSTIFDKYNTPKDFIKLETHKLEQMIHSCGFYKNKTKNIQKASQVIINNFNEIVPNTMEELLTIPGIGRKSANCILSDAFNTSVGVAIDTHAKRICTRIGISQNTNPIKIEQDLLNVMDKKYWQKLNLILVTHGRNICSPKNPKCSECPCNKYCNYFKTNN